MTNKTISTIHAVQKSKPFLVEIQGADLVSTKILGLCMEILDLTNDSAQLINKVVFTTDPQMRDVGMAYINQKSIHININSILEQILEPRDNNKLSIRGEYVLQILHAIGHECGHFDHTKKVEDFSKIPYDKKEEYADEFATQMLLDIAEKYDIEPVELNKEPFLGARLQELFIVCGGQEIIRRERRLLSENLIYKDENTGLKLSSLRDFVHRRYADGVSWRQKTYPAVFKFEPGREPVYENNMAAYFETVAIEDWRPLDAEDTEEHHTNTTEQEKEENTMAANTFTEEAIQVTTTIDAGIEAATNTLFFEEDTLMTQAFQENNMVQAIEDNFETSSAFANEEMQKEQRTKQAAAGIGPVIIEKDPITHSQLSLPPHIAAMMTGMAAGMEAKTTTKPEAIQLKPNNYPAEKLIAFMQDVYKTLYYHIFNVCGWNGTPQMGAQDWNFSAPENVVAKPVSIAHIIHAHGMPDVIVGYNTHDASGKKLWGANMERCENGIIRGEIFAKSKLPGYTLYCNFYGKLYKRVLAPQNTAKNSTYANRARSGECIAWVIKGEGSENNKFIGHFANGKWVPANN